MDNPGNNDVDLPAPGKSHPMANRKTVIALENKTGKVIALDSTNFGIQPDEGGPVLLPVNLPQDFKKVGTMIKFDGEIKETEMTELWAGQLLLLKHVKKI